jgi:hypothetical protein
MPAPKSDRQEPAEGEQDHPPIRLAHVLFVLWVAGSVAWAFFAAKFAHGQGWWVLRPALAAVLVLTPPILAHLLAKFVIGITGNPRFRS